MGMKVRIAISATFLFIIIGFLVGLYIYMDYGRVDTSAIVHIKNAQTKPNKFNDPSGDIQVSSVNDIGFLVKGNYFIDIHYGRKIISMNEKCFKDKEFRELLEDIGIKVYTHSDKETGNILYKVTYWEEEVDQYSKVN